MFSLRRLFHFIPCTRLRAAYSSLRGSSKVILHVMYSRRRKRQTSHVYCYTTLLVIMRVAYNNLVPAAYLSCARYQHLYAAHDTIYIAFKSGGVRLARCLAIHSPISPTTFPRDACCCYCMHVFKQSIPVSISNLPLLSTIGFCDKSWCREGVREGTQGHPLQLETAPVLLCRFFIVGVEL